MKKIKLLDGLATLDQVQAVWAEVSKDGRTTCLDMSKRIGISKTKVHSILKFLAAAGYLERERHRYACRVNIPLVDGSMVHGLPMEIKWATPLKEPITEPEAG